jgi:TonB family protein
MLVAFFRSYLSSLAAPARLGAAACCSALALALSFSAGAQQPAQPAQPEAAQQPATQSGESQPPTAPAEEAPKDSTTNAAPVAPQAAPAGPQTPPAAEAAKASEASQPGGISDEELKRLLVGKALYLREGYLDNSLKFDERGGLVGHSAQGSYTLSAIEINKVRLTRHKVELEGIRYGLHFVGQLASEDPSTAFDRVRITPKKRAVTITIDREIVVKPKKQKIPRAGREKDKKAKQGALAATPAQPGAGPTELSEADQLKSSIAAAPEAERPADAKSVTTTTSPAHARKLLKDALDRIFALGLDESMMAAMPDFWRLYYEAAAAKTDYRPKDPAILRQNTVDQKALLLTKFEPESNEFAQANGVAGMALYHTVIGPDGKAQEIAVGRPIGFGLDENAVAAIRKASFQPAVKDGKPVPVLLDLVVQFRIFDKRTAAASPPEPAEKPAEPVLPGPYSVQHP